jgi:hypothetical protein
MDAGPFAWLVPFPHEIYRRRDGREQEGTGAMGQTLSRRTLGAMLAAISATTVTRAVAQDATPAATPLPEGADVVDGVAGGGTLSQMGVDVPFSFMAFSSPGPEGEPVIGGFMRLVDESTLNHPLVIEATEILTIAPLSAQSTTGRQVTGWGTLNMHGHYPFMLQVDDLGDPGSGEDTFNLVFGEAALPFLTGEDKSGCDCGGLGYAIRSNVVEGDISVIGTS